MKDDRLSLREEGKMDSCGRTGRKLGKGDPAPTLSPGNISAEDYIDRETGGKRMKISYIREMKRSYLTIETEDEEQREKGSLGGRNAGTEQNPGTASQ